MRSRRALILLLALGAAAAFFLLGPGLRAFASDSKCDNVLDCEAGCTDKDASACRKAGLLYLRGKGIVRSVDRALTFLRAACTAKDGEGCSALASTLRASEGSDANEEVLATLKAACDLRDPAGCEGLANAYADGEGVTPDAPRARTLYQLACDRGAGASCSALGKLTEREDPAASKKHHARAVKLLRVSCKAGVATACAQLGFLEERGIGTVVDLKAAAASYLAGCDGDDGPSCYNLAALRNHASATDDTVPKLFARACKLGVGKACRFEATDPRAVCEAMRERGELKEGVSIDDCASALRE